MKSRFEISFSPYRILIGLVLVILLINFTSTAQPIAKHSLNREAHTTKLRLLVFSGSDWCLPCINFDQSVLQSKSFRAFAELHLTIEIADFPQHKKLSKSEIEQNERLAEKYNSQGIFPHVLLLDNKGKILRKIITNKANTEQVILQIKPFLPDQKLVEVSTSIILMGSAFNITLVTNKSLGDQYLKQCVDEIKSWLSSWRERSTTSQLNSMAGKEAIEVSATYYQLLERCLEISRLTQGAFDVSFSGLSALYKFDGEEHPLPDKELVAEKLSYIGYTNINMLPGHKVFLSDVHLQIAFGAIGKGFAADKVKKLMIDQGVIGGVVNAGGDLTTWGRRYNGEMWQVGIPDPDIKESIILNLPLDNLAMATSGDYEKYFTWQGKKYSHIINPKTGLPVIGARSVSVISNSGEFSDAMATAVSVLGLEIGMDLINQLENVECVFIDNNRKLHFSNGLQPVTN